MDLLKNILDLFATGATIIGGALIVWGGIAVGTNLKDHNGPMISNGLWQMAGGAVVILCAQYFATLV